MPEIKEIVRGLLYILKKAEGDSSCFTRPVSVTALHHYHIPSQLSQVPKIVSRMIKELTGLGFDKKWVADCTSAATEAISNAIEHGNRLDASKKVEIVTILLEAPEGRYYYMFIQDEGTDRHFSFKRTPEFEESVRSLAKRGRGLALIAAFVDIALFVRGKGTGVILMKKAPTPKKPR